MRRLQIMGLLFSIVFLLSGCKGTDGIIQGNESEVSENVVTQKTEISLTEIPAEPTGELKEAWTEEQVLEKTYALIEQKDYPMAMSILLKNPRTQQTNELLKELQYLISGEYILNLDYGSFAAINKEGNVVFRLYDEQRFGDEEKVKRFQNGKSLHKTYLEGVAMLGWDGNMETSQTESGYYAYDRLVTWMEQRRNDPNLPKIVYLDTAGNSFLARDEKGELFYYDPNGDPADDIVDRIEALTDVVDMEICQEGVVVLCSDGTVDYVGRKDKASYIPYSMSSFFENINGWTDIVDIDSSIGDFVAGLKADGTVVISAEWVGEGSFVDVKNWTDIIAISVGFQSVMGLKKDGTVVYSGHVTEAQKAASEWKDIVAVSANFQTCLGLKADGTLVIAGENTKGEAISELFELGDLFIPVVENKGER